MKPLWMLPMIAALASFPAIAGKVDVETGDGCFGVDCLDGEVELPAVTPPENDEEMADEAKICETVAARVYQLCLAGPDADAARCVAERTEALGRCENPVDPVDQGSPSGVSLGPTSSGVYRIPYRDGTDVKVSFDYFTHSPDQGKIDMHAKSRSDPAIVAAADGTIRIIQDSRSKWQHPWDELHKGPCMNNFVWIEHDNGEWSKYSHMQQWSTTKRAGLSVGDRVEQGDLLGYEGKVGCAGSSHLHFEVAVPGIEPAKPFDPAHPYVYFDANGGGLLANAKSNRNRNPRICGIATVTFQHGESYTAIAGPGAVAPGDDEIVRHGMPVTNYQCFIRRGVLAGYQTVWVDFFELGGELFVNVIMRPKTRSWRSRSDLNADDFLAQNKAMKRDGYRLSHIETYRDGAVRYAGIWEKRGTPAQQLYIGKSAAEHQAEAERLTELGYRPRSVSVVDDGDLRYSGLWEQVEGRAILRSTLKIPEYQALATQFAADDWEVAALNAYETKEGPRISAIWYPAQGKSQLATALGKAEFSDQRDVARKLGLKTVAVTAHEENGRGKYTAVFHQ